MGRRAKYPDAFRRDAVGLVTKSGRTIADVARSLGISERPTNYSSSLSSKGSYTAGFLHLGLGHG
jgi:Transposase